MRTRQEIETALDSWHLWVKAPTGNYWQVRRNGKTQTWKRSPDRFRIPIRYGFKDCGAIDETNLQTDELVIALSKPEPWKGK